MNSYDEKWLAIEKRLGTDYGPGIVKELKKLNEFFGDGILEWLAELYDPESGGFYYSVSARDNEGFLPDVESTLSALESPQTFGAANGKSWHDLWPDWLKKKIGDFVYEMQDEDGYFYHKQWPKSDCTELRNARTLGVCVKLLDFAGRKPKYSVPSSAASTSSPSYDLEKAPERFRSVENFKKYIYEELDFRTRAYHSGSTLSSQWGEVEFYSKILGADLGQIAVEHIDSLQRPDNGLWHENVDYYGANGVHKMSWIYGTKRKIPYVDKALDSIMTVIMSDEPIDATVDAYNPWHALSVLLANKKYAHNASEEEMKDIMSKIYSFAPMAIKKSLDKIRPFKHADNGLSYFANRSCHSSYGNQISVKNSAEGEVNGALCAYGVYIYVCQALGIGDIKVPTYCEEDVNKFIRIIEEKEEKYTNMCVCSVQRKGE